ncbi:MAG: acetyl-CoA hydrolase, partial [Acidobacteriota bacterium]
MSYVGAYPRITPEEAASKIPDGATVSFSGFAAAGAAKLVPRAIAARAREMHQKGKPYQIRVLTGSSSGDTIDEPLAEANAISWRAPYQNSAPLRRQINCQEIEYIDMHLSGLSRTVQAGFFGAVDVAVIEATDVTP